MDKELALTIFNAQTDIVLITVGGEEIDMCNSAFLDFFGFNTIEDFKKKHKCICDFFVEEDGYIKKEEDGKLWIDTLLSQKANTSKAKIIYKGNEFIFIIKGKSIEHDSKQRVVVSLHDNTDLEYKTKQLENEIASKNSDILKMNSIFTLAEKHLNIGIFELDVKTKELVASDGLYNMLELERTKTTLLNDVLSKISSLDIAEIELSIMQMLNDFQENSFSFKIITNDGSLKLIVAYFKPKIIAKKRKFICIFQDNTEKYLLEKLQDQQESMDFLKHKIKSQKEMLKSIAHHWRQPLTAISLIVSNIEFELDNKNISNSKLDGMLDGISEKTQFLSKTINEFINISSIKEEKESIELKSEIEKIINLNTPFYKDKNIDINVRANMDIELKIFKEELLSIVESCISNSIESIEKKRSIPGFENLYGAIEITISKTEEKCRIDIEDNGGGITKSEAQKAFEPYYTTKFMNPGIGLSLYFAKVIINTHFDGDIYFSDIYSEGALLIIEFIV